MTVQILDSPDPWRGSEVHDVSGAGDTVIATLAACLASVMELPEAAGAANTAAGIVLGKLGAQPVTIDELRSTMQINQAH